MRRKTEGLTFPTDPLAAMRDLQDLDAPPGAVSESPLEGREQQNGDAYTTSNTVVLPTSSTDYGVTRMTPEPSVSDYSESQVGHPPTPSSTVGIKAVRTTSSVVGNATDILRQAVLSLLAQPLAGDPGKGPFTVTSIKVHQQIWERLGHVAGVTGRNKQDLVAEALLDLFAKIRREEEEGA